MNSSPQETAKPRIAIATTSRADFGYTANLLRALDADGSFEVDLLVSGTHLSSEHGRTVDEIRALGFLSYREVPIPCTATSAHEIAHTMSSAILGFSKAFTDLRPELLVVFGDRFEMLCAAQSAVIHRIPIVHINGGDVSSGAYDDSFRHALTKLSDLHFVTHAKAAERVMAMGEQPERVFNVGSLALDSVAHTQLLSRAELESVLGIAFRKKIIVLTYHPATATGDESSVELQSIIGALKGCDDDTTIVITKPGYDVGSDDVVARLTDFARSRSGCIIVDSLGSRRYLSLLKIADLCLGNSSSGIYEAPFVGTPTVNVGQRQAGRTKGPSVIDCTADSAQIYRAIQQGFERKGRINPSSLYGDGASAAKIVGTLRRFTPFTALGPKRFHDARAPLVLACAPERRE